MQKFNHYRRERLGSITMQKVESLGGKCYIFLRTLHKLRSREEEGHNIVEKMVTISSGPWWFYLGGAQF